MIISATGGKKDFAPCPEYTGKAVCVDVTPLKEYETEIGRASCRERVSRYV